MGWRTEKKTKPQQQSPMLNGGAVGGETERRWGRIPVDRNERCQKQRPRLLRSLAFAERSEEDGVSSRGKKAPRRMQPQKRTLLSAFFFPREDVGRSPDRSIPREQGEEEEKKERGEEGALPIGRREPGDSK